MPLGTIIQPTIPTFFRWATWAQKGKIIALDHTGFGVLRQEIWGLTKLSCG